MPHSFHVGVKGIIGQNNKVLLLKFRRRDGQLSWDLPGGRIDDDETIEEAFVREIAEELPGLSKPRLEKLVHAERASENFPSGEGLLWLFYTASATITHLDEQTEHEGYEWIEKSNITSLAQRPDLLLPPAFATALAKI